MKVVLLHCYSSDNLGDGMLVDRAVDLITEALGPDTDIDLVAAYPESFQYLGLRCVSSKPGSLGEARRYLQVLRNLDAYDLVVGVGGGYLRFGSSVESAKTAIVHGPQLLAAGRTHTPTVYLPQSIGPSRGAARRLVRNMIGSLDAVCLRDDRSIEELGTAPNIARIPDVAIISGSVADRGTDDAAAPGRTTMPRVVLSVRSVRGTLPRPVTELAGMLGKFDGYVQSAVAGNNDTTVMESLGPAEILTPRELLDPRAEPRVVVAMRLHAALMALEAGHYVIHLAYERKGFGAFADLGLDAYVHHFRSFTPAVVEQQVARLLDDPAERATYDRLLAQRADAHRARWRELRDRLRTSVGLTPELHALAGHPG
ncbi:polysaccharide pyruvyl transferase family protein [Gordonia polyisoprenivorans]|uniref:polysaccharide pyruvyl transferase family protein n=1 Tax=Gordonia polyisoprenivorans TaxID=84595 RepID=UPI0030CAEBF3